jgi:putative membrane-bound dehydrogenase-like protein
MKIKLSITILSLSALFFIGSTGKRTEDAPGLLVPEGFTIESAVAAGSLSYPMFASFDGSGRLFVFESTEPNTMGTAKMLASPSYHIRLLEDTDGDGNFEKNLIFAKDIPFPKGGVFYQGSLYVTESPNLVRYTDTTGDGVSDKREVILTGWTLNSNGATLGGPFFGPDGWMYITDARRGFNITTKENKVLKGKGARIWRCRPDGTGLEAMSGGGFDNSIEIAFMPGGETIGTMTYFVDPQDGQRDALMHWVEGGTYPKPNSVIAEDGLKLTGDLMPVMTKMPRVAPSGMMRYRGTGFGPDFEGNLFNAEFNTGRIMRHIVSPDGATYKTVDEIFMKSASSDSHPTDVLQDADGSLLVVVTGGWFIEGCPLSRVAKPDVKGGIYRIRKTGAPIVSDPRGKKLNLAKQSPQNLVRYLTDPRPVVRDNAIEQLVLLGHTAVTPIVQALPGIKDEEMRAAAIFALSRINTAAAWATTRNGLNDKSSVVRTASARVLGLAKDVKSLDKLMALVQKDDLPVRRQAATALGQIGDIKAVPALLQAASDVDDRFVKHAIIHSLIVLKNPDPLVKALENPSANVRVAALTALDQMDGAPLKKEYLVPVLGSKDPALRSTGIWIASHHPEWTDIVISFLEKSLGDGKLSETDAAAVSDMMLTFMKEPGLQDFVAKQLGNPSATSSRKLLMLDVISRSALKELPGQWVTEIGKQLQSNDAAVRSQVLGLIESRRLKALNSNLDQIIRDGKTSVDFRLKALSARIMSSPALSDAEFQMLVKYTGKEYDSPVRQLAVRLLNHAELNDDQLLVIARTQIGKTDPFLLPAFMEAFEGNSNEQVGKELIGALQSGNGRLDNLSEQDFARLLKKFPPAVHEMAEPLVAKLKAQHAERLAHLQDMEARLKGGDVGEGRKLFFGKASCYSCHAVGSEGGRFGPDLTNIGEIRSKHDILEAVVYPSASFAREYETFRVVTKTTAYTGIIKEQLPESIVIEVGPAPGLRIPRSEITAIEPQTLSMMPPGLDQQLTASEMASLTAFLEALPYRLDRMIQARENK